LLTSIVLGAATIAVIGLWEHYMVSPWTRDGQVRVQVADIAPQVAGQIVEIQKRDRPSDGPIQ
jgi:multidrug resistance efflux pump